MSQAVNLLPSIPIQGYCQLLPLTKGSPSMVVYEHSKIRTSRKLTFVCSTPSSPSSNHHRRNPDFSRQTKGYSRGRTRQNQDRERFEAPQENHPPPSKNGPVISFSNNPRYSATATPGQREKEIVQLFRKVQSQLRQRTAIKEEKKIESLQQGGGQGGGGEKGTVDSLLKLLRKHSVDRRKVSSSSDRDNSITEQQQERENKSLDEENSNSKFFETDTILNADEDIKKPATAEISVVATSSRPPSKFQRRSPVPRVKFQPVYSAEKEEVMTEKEDELEKEAHLDPVFFDELAEDSSESDMMDDDLEDEMEEEEEEEDEEEEDDEEEEEEETLIENPVDLSSMKLVELKEFAKSRGVKGYSKLKKIDLVKLLEGL
ncbi:SAP-like protein BP-73, putative, expressed [Zostera marina]|uniref:SAP-like protein BP-73, putative, expressed n=1 Tax=Zostera marina TaxID=29655 RepID=A0A0K9PGE8_ZOSMR|nr:SAP-like protein BP-73, putative, expressed [Zostera marina]